jgi:hypothetical protein
MSQDVAFRRKVIYIAAIAALLYPLFRIGQPASKTSEGETNPGGVLAQLRAKYDLSQAQLGDIDPASESMKLATLGLRGVAANWLWKKANDYKMKEDWENLKATLNQITKLQPNFIAVWEFQSHNLSYNISTEFDDYRQRYHWVKKGISFLIEGTHYNRDNPALLHWVGWYLGQKIGRADEHVQFRELFRADGDFHEEIQANGVSVDEGRGYDARPDNWLVGRQWYLWGQRAVDTKGMPLKSKSPLIFHADAPMSLINYASDIEEEGILDEVARRAWTEGGNGWAEYGRRPIPTSWGHNIRLAELPQIREEIDRLRAKLDALAGEAREQILQERIAKLTPEQRAVMKLKETELDATNYGLWVEAREKTFVKHQEVAQRAPAAVRDKALKLAGRLNDEELLSSRTGSYRSIINYEYWELRCKAEQTKPAVDARAFLYKAQKAHDKAELETAREMYEQAWKQWRVVYDQFPRLMDDVAADDVVEAIKRYRKLLQDLDEQLPDNFLLRNFLEVRRQDLSKFFQKKGATAKPGQPAAGEPKPSTEKPTAEKPATEKPATEKPATEKPASEKPASEKPASEKPASEKPASEKPPVDRPDKA